MSLQPTSMERWTLNTYRASATENKIKIASSKLEANQGGCIEYEMHPKIALRARNMGVCVCELATTQHEIRVVFVMHCWSSLMCFACFLLAHSLSLLLSSSMLLLVSPIVTQAYTHTHTLTGRKRCIVLLSCANDASQNHCVRCRHTLFSQLFQVRSRGRIIIIIIIIFVCVFVWQPVCVKRTKWMARSAFPSLFPFASFYALRHTRSHTRIHIYPVCCRCWFRFLFALSMNRNVRAPSARLILICIFMYLFPFQVNTTVQIYPRCRKIHWVRNCVRTFIYLSIGWWMRTRRVYERRFTEMKMKFICQQMHRIYLRRCPAFNLKKKKKKTTNNGLWPKEHCTAHCTRSDFYPSFYWCSYAAVKFKAINIFMFFCIQNEWI